MSDLIALSFHDPDRASHVKDQLLALQRTHLVDLEDAAVVVRKDNGKVKLKQTVDLTARGTLSGGFWGTLIGLLFLAPVWGLAAGMAVGAVSGALADVGIDDRFMKDLGKELTPNSSALFILVRKVSLDKVLAQVEGIEDATVLHTSLDVDDERTLRHKLDAHDVDPESTLAA